MNTGKRKGKYIPCRTCGKSNYVGPRDIRAHKYHYCNIICRDQDHEHRVQIGIKSMLSQIHKPSKQEIRFKDILIKNGINFIDQFRYKLGIADFFILPNIIVECDGKYWHNKPTAKVRNPIQNEWLKSNGYDVYRFSEDEVTKDINACIAKLPIFG